MVCSDADTSTRDSTVASLAVDHVDGAWSGTVGMSSQFKLRRTSPRTPGLRTSLEPVHSQVDMAAYYKAAECSLTRNCSADWVSATRLVDDTLAHGTPAAQIALKRRLLEARARSPQDLSATPARPTDMCGTVDPWRTMGLAYARRHLRPG